MAWGPYFALDSLNASKLANIAKSPFEYRHRLQVPVEDNDTFRVGRAFHSAVFEPELFEGEYCFAPMSRNEKHEAYRAFKAENEGKTILTKAQHQQATMVSRVIRKRPRVRQLLESHGGNEVTYTWCLTGSDGLAGRPCKVRLDREVFSGGHTDIVMELKTHRAPLGAVPCARSIATYGYHWKAAWQLDAVHAVTGHMPSHYYFLFVSVEDPYPAAIYRLEEEAIEQGRREYKAMLELLFACERTNTWPDRTDSPLPIGIPSWHRLDLVPSPEATQ